MNARLFISLSSTLALLSAAACSSSSSPGGGPKGELVGAGSDGGTVTLGSIPPAFSKYCTGTLMTSMGVMEADGAGAWLSDGSIEAASGTEFLLAADAFGWSGYLFLSDGTPLRLSSDSSPGLVLGTTFSSSCAPSTPQNASSTEVLLGPATLYPSMSLSGKACTLPAGTTLTNYSFEGGNPATVSSAEITAQCGTMVMYTDDFPMAGLI
jgi:hypothetical protein